MSFTLRYILLGIFVLVLLTSIFLGFQYFNVSRGSTNVTNQNTSNSLSDSLKTVGETILSSGQKVIVVNNVSSYSIDIPVNKDVENLVGTLKIFSDQPNKVTAVKIVTADSLVEGNDYSIDDKVWVKTSSKVENNVLFITLAIDRNVVSGLKGVDWNSQISYVILSELYNQSPSYLNTPVSNRLDLIGKLIRDRKSLGNNKYYFEIKF